MSIMRIFLVLIVSRMLLSLITAQEVALHFKPRDHALGDVHPFFHEGECLLYYLKPGKYESALARSKDWLRWTETPLTHAEVTPEDWMSPYFVLGVFRDDAAGVFRSFHGHAQGRMVSSVSDDLLHWSCAPKEFHVPAAGYYHRRRDPFVFWIPEMRQYGCVMTTWMKDRPKETGGAVSLATSPDLKRWEDRGPVLDPGTLGEPECPQMFSLGGRWHLLASIYDRAVGQPVYWTSGSPLGPWKTEPSGRLDGKDLCAAQIAFDGETPVLFGWIPLTPAKPGRQTWGGHLALPREVIALPDGQLGTRLPPRLIKALSALPWSPAAGLELGVEPRALDGEWHRLAVEFQLTMPDAVREVRASIAPLGEIAFQRDVLRVLDPAGGCWSELPARVPGDRAITVRLFIEGDIVELFTDDRHSLAARLPAKAGKLRLSLRADGSGASIAGFRVAEWRMP